jgi:hypothetical protein
LDLLIAIIYSTLSLSLASSNMVLKTISVGLGSVLAMLMAVSYVQLLQLQLSTAKVHFNIEKLMDVPPVDIHKEEDDLVISAFVNSTTSLPTVYKEYFAWHYQQRKKLFADPSKFLDYKFLILECHANTTSYIACGGISDRLTALPLLVWLAHKYNRLLFISWTRPMGLEEFLEPSTILDWRLPPSEELYSHIYSKETPSMLLFNEDQAELYTKVSEPVVRTHLQTAKGDGSDILKKLSGGLLMYDQIYHDLWYAMFQPVPRLAAKISAELQVLGLIPGQYAAAHVRHYYPPLDLDAKVVHKRNVRALKCASQSNPGVLILFATDYHKAMSSARNISLVVKKEAGIDIVTMNKDKKLLHFDQRDAQGVQRQRPPEDYDDVFLDLYMLGQARCVSKGRGGYGRFGMRLSSGAAYCGSDHATSHPKIPCQWTCANGTTFGKRH